MADHWDAALGAHPGLRVDFGHFGGAESGSLEFLKRLTPGSGSAGANAFVDASYFNELLDAEPELLDAINNLLVADAAGAKVLQGRMLYGSDWKMLLQEESAADYLSRFESLLTQVNVPGATAPGTQFADAFFGRNAAHFLGLRSGDPNRRRLESFYRQQGVRGNPIWLQKVDALI